MTGATLCSGIGAPEVSTPEIDWLWCAEVEPFPCSVLSVRHGKPNIGDITAADFVERALAHGRPDVMVAGTPCQAFSVAGNRESLSDERGNLTLRFVEIVDAIEPRIICWENVPGVLSTKDNAFGCFLGALAGHDTALVPMRGQRWCDAGMVDGPKRRIAWRVLDAQYLGLAQRRERVFVVACPRNGADPAEILFERKGVQRHSAPRRETGQDAAPTLNAGPVSGGRTYGTCADTAGGLVPEVSMCLNAGGMGRIDGESETFIAHSLRGEGFDASEDGTGRGTPIVPTIAFSAKDWGGDAREDLAPTVCAQQDSYGGHAIEIATKMAVRRLTPRECERLQGFPDDHTLIEHRGKSAADGPRYKALGNSMAVPVLRWILRRAMEAAA